MPMPMIVRIALVAIVRMVLVLVLVLTGSAGKLRNDKLFADEDPVREFL